MQDREPIIPDHIWSLPRKPAGLPDVLSRNRDDVLVLREPYGERARPVLLATMALAVSFALGWAGALHWPEVANLIGVDQIAQKDVPSPAIAEAKPAARSEGIRKTASASDLRTAAPATVGSIPKPSAVGVLASCGSVERGFRLAGQYESSRSGDGDEAVFGARAGNEADNHPRLDRCRGAGRNRGSRGPRRNSRWPRAATRFPESGELIRSCAGATAGSLPPRMD